MSDKYKIYDPNAAYFVTLTIVGWIDVFSKREYKTLIIDSLKFCQQHKGLIIYGFCLMSNHLHMICQAGKENSLSQILRDFKKFTSKQIINKLNEDMESRREWMLHYFSFAGKYLSRVKSYKVWQDGNHAIIIYSNEFLAQKLNYIHNNPVKELIVEKAEDYMFSSARNYAELDNYLDIELVTPKLKTGE